MKYGKLIIEKKEKEFLKQVMSLAKYYKDNTYKTSIEKLNEELKHAQIVTIEKMPQDVIRLNSLVTIETPYAVKKTYQIVTPDKSDLRKDKISILAPMGLALFGYAEGDEVSWQFPMGESSIKIIKVLQAEKIAVNGKFNKQHSETS
ncbi:GreA/GreB family elongation factor [Salegentibacter sp. F188]|uniref:GreA/GreB family elongation factor n=1 Tax=Autumnicola patrickiae TaxID=3075591 RepID=A0ABU3DYJ6_9FLAO|nr:GreA/GreB family elongation factor [Salegentibacter sp. F188]MDT0688805.1 GreA/GreB family elongation factor [Salegentibacter sp. F188]